MQKKALAFNMVVLLTLVAIVVVVMLFLIGRSTGIYLKSTSCESTGGKCIKAADCEGKNGFLPGCKKDEICCMQESDFK